MPYNVFALQPRTCKKAAIATTLKAKPKVKTDELHI